MSMNETLKEKLKKEEEKSFEGWDFSYLKNRLVEPEIPWSYRDKVKDFLKPETKLLDMGTGGGEFLLSLSHPYNLTAATEGWEPNYELCKRRLEPLGITVEKTDDNGEIPFDDNSFDVIINRHEYYNLDEVSRVLKKGGFFVTQQVGGMNDRELSSKLIKDYSSRYVEFNLENEVTRFELDGLIVMYRNQFYGKSVFYDTGAIVFYAKNIPWNFPSFSVDSSLESLENIQKHIDKVGFYETTYHRFIIIAKNRKP